MRVRWSSDAVVRGATVCLTWFVAVVLLEHAIRDDLAPGRHRVSEYAVGSGGWLMTTGFVAWAASFALTSIALRRGRLRPSPVATLLISLMAVCAVGAVGTAVFETGTSAGMLPPGQELTAADQAHDIASAALQLSLFAAVVSSLAIAGSRHLRTTIIALVGCSAVVSVLFSGPLLDLPGARQRALLGVAWLWHFLLLRTVHEGVRPRAS
ncbi:MAG TPA: DUF998 domain-containing protein [Solirubrobacteraceae bacterium]|nr:DUF998 domain-containing protein [Solirubrobacteraceae bacterium]